MISSRPCPYPRYSDVGGQKMIFVYFLLMIIAFLFYILYNGPISYYLFFFLLALPVFGFIWILISSRKTTVSMVGQFCCAFLRLFS